MKGKNFCIIIWLLLLFILTTYFFPSRYFCSIGFAIWCVQRKTAPVFQECICRIHCWLGPYNCCDELVSGCTGNCGVGLWNYHGFLVINLLYYFSHFLIVFLLPAGSFVYCTFCNWVFGCSLLMEWWCQTGLFSLLSFLISLFSYQC